jgi:hypothetical protein
VDNDYALKFGHRHFGITLQTSNSVTSSIIFANIIRISNSISAGFTPKTTRRSNIQGHAYPDEPGATALMIRFHNGFQYVVTFTAAFAPFLSNLLKNLQIFLFSLKQPDRHNTRIITRPCYAIDFFETLKDAIDRYEEKFGYIRTKIQEEYDIDSSSKF